MDSKGIFNIEILVMLMFFIIFFSLFMSLTIEEFTSIDETQNRKESRILTSDISHILNQVYKMGDGYSVTYVLPSKINKESYVLKINDSGVYVNSHYQLTFSKIFPNIINSQEYYLEPGNMYEFTNKNNSISIKLNN